jgi:hypothetical protein
MTEEEKHKAINDKITQHWDKMCQDEKRITSYNSEQWDDLLAFTIAEFLEKKSLDYQYEVAVINDKLPNYIGKAMSLGIKSQTSPYWHKIRKPMYNTRGTYEAEYDPEYVNSYNELQHHDLPLEEINPHECLLVALTKLNFYDATLIQEYFIEGKTYSELYTKYGITLNNLRKDINTAVNRIRKHCSQFVPEKLLKTKTKTKL